MQVESDRATKQEIKKYKLNYFSTEKCVECDLIVYIDNKDRVSAKYNNDWYEADTRSQLINEIGLTVIE